MKNLLSSIVLLSILLIFSCKKETFTSSKDARISLSADTIHFDTVFTTVKSVTQSFKIKNDNNQKLRFNDISIKGGASSYFKINVDGIPGPSVKDVEVEAND